ncbi:glycosyltransferase [Halomonas sp. SpR8]|uniref:glycosyltransferase n=1 Tax=Halomonas sp. SpR8 TaxID=3050463 RepID=UPI0027E3C4FE|nr:glycosyltransferase [Halomonas sp. SpR8]MDQ7727264.1 glycosyltransferase [Halomonas sp. SpR8]
MIFITVGTQLPFDRLLEYFSDWQKNAGYTGKVVAQVGIGSRFTSNQVEMVETLTSEQYYQWFSQAEGVVSHAGMGSILSCLDYGKRGVFLPRQYTLNEHRNDHQLDTATAFKEKYPTLTFCADKQAFFIAMDALIDAENNTVSPISPQLNDELGRNIADYLGFKGKLK